MSAEPSILIVPGLSGSGPDHWQTLWERCFPRIARVEQRDWDRPALGEWLDTLVRAIRAGSDPAVIVAHSLGCALAVHAASRFPDLPVRAALLVAPADVESPAHTPEMLRQFAPLPRTPLPFPSTVLASRNDPYVDFERARAFAGAWGAELVDVGPAGHINAASGLGDWPFGRSVLGKLCSPT
jgi:uncharacterized protein